MKSQKVIVYTRKYSDINGPFVFYELKERFLATKMNKRVTFHKSLWTVAKVNVATPHMVFVPILTVRSVNKYYERNEKCSQIFAHLGG